MGIGVFRESWEPSTPENSPILRALITQERPSPMRPSELWSPPQSHQGLPLVVNGINGGPCHGYDHSTSSHGDPDPTSLGQTQTAQTRQAGHAIPMALAEPQKGLDSFEDASGKTQIAQVRLDVGRLLVSPLQNGNPGCHRHACAVYPRRELPRQSKNHT